MKSVSLAFILSFSFLAQAKDWSQVKCPSDAQLAASLVRAEVNGWRVPNAKPQCLRQKNFKYFQVGPAQLDEKVSLDFIVRDKKSFRITKVEKKTRERVEVSFTVFKKAKGRAVAVNDTLTFWRPAGPAKKSIGCAALVATPKKRFVRQGCRP